MKNLLIVIVSVISISQCYEYSNGKVRRHLYSGRYRLMKMQNGKSKPDYGRPMYIESIGKDNKDSEQLAKNVIECSREK